MRRTLISIVALVMLALPAQAVGLHTGDYTAPFTTSQINPATAPPSRSVGKIHLVHPNGIRTGCSAGVVDANNQSTLITAAHCVFSKGRGGLASSATFVPAFNDGLEPFGEWPSKRIVPSAPWMLSGHSHFDFAFIVLGRDSRGRYAEDVVGGLPIAFNQPRSQAYRVFGYPSVPAPPYNGQQMWACDSVYGGDVYDPDPDEQYGPPIMYTGCNFDHGASGGPWLNASGVVASVLSTLIPPHPNIVGGPYLGDDAAALFASVTGVAPPKRCKKGKRGKRRAVAAKKKCKKRGKKRGR